MFIPIYLKHSSIWPSVVVKAMSNGQLFVFSVSINSTSIHININTMGDSTTKIRQDVRIFAPQDFSPFLEKNYPNPFG
jgi:hypothetical protein